MNNAVQNPSWYTNRTIRETGARTQISAFESVLLHVFIQWPNYVKFRGNFSDLHFAKATGIDPKVTSSYEKQSLYIACWNWMHILKDILLIMWHSHNNGVSQSKVSWAVVYQESTITIVTVSETMTNYVIVMKIPNRFWENVAPQEQELHGKHSFCCHSNMSLTTLSSNQNVPLPPYKQASM